MQLLILVILLVYAGIIAWHRFKPMPCGTDFKSPVCHVDPEDVCFLFDLRYRDRQGNLVFEENIFPAVYSAINKARQSILADMFLYNSDHGRNRLIKGYRPHTSTLTDLLAAGGDRGVDVLLITDEINNFYYSYESPILEKLRKHRVKTVITSLDRLRDANPLYSGWYRLFFSWIPLHGSEMIKHPFGHPEKRISVKSLLRALNFKANHRKVLVVDSELAVVTSANPHDPSSLHSNIAFSIKGEPAKQVEYAEHAVAAFSGHALPGFEKGPPGPDDQANDAYLTADKEKYQVQVLTEKAIKVCLLSEIRNTAEDDLIMLCALYLTDRQTIKELIKAAARGAMVRIILDACEYSFGLKKFGIPNKHASLDFYADPNFRRSLHVKWYKTHGEQYHAKLAAFHRKDSFTVIGGSANFTSKNLDNYNLELNICVATGPDSPLCREVMAYFDRLWYNKDGLYTLDYSVLKDESSLKYLLYRIQEGSGICTY